MSTAGLYLLTDEYEAEIERLGGPIHRCEDGWAFAIVDRKIVVGGCRLSEANEAICWIAVPYRHKGYATFGIRMLLEFAFRNCRLDRVTAVITNPVGLRVVEKHGFTPTAAGPRYELTRSHWLEHRNGPAFARLHPVLKAMLEAELAAGNEIVESGGGWPDADSVFVRLRDPFRTKPPSTDGLDYTEPNDPHWWKADWSSRSPRHILAC